MGFEIVRFANITDYTMLITILVIIKIVLLKMNFKWKGNYANVWYS